MLLRWKHHNNAVTFTVTALKTSNLWIQESRAQHQQVCYISFPLFSYMRYVLSPFAAKLLFQTSLSPTGTSSLHLEMRASTERGCSCTSVPSCLALTATGKGLIKFNWTPKFAWSHRISSEILLCALTGKSTYWMFLIWVPQGHEVRISETVRDLMSFC